ncbi:distal membrane-arm assembly complex protein 1 isoform X2 [Chiloscyllium plagiosum]|uniref:distal membrane-arm assembly complex protein 1 isoform X2 n=1 Tax=Chiloscyllium plagiosum TaxID=36176 RepID=UPI001CB7BF36|nr:distal membrane-arm assembly complex protein 1 isoform X2 [Chiloscyllium plagiosum]
MCPSHRKCPGWIPALVPPPVKVVMAPPGRLGDCRGCRLVCGLGLLGAGGYVFASARRLMRKTGAAPGPGTVWLPGAW